MVTVCLCLFSHPHYWTYSAQLWHGGPHLPREGYRIHFAPVPLPPGPGEAKEWFWRSVQPKRCNFTEGVPLGSGALKMGFPSTIFPNYEWFAWVWILLWAQALQPAEALQQVLKMHRKKQGTPATLK